MPLQVRRRRGRDMRSGGSDLALSRHCTSPLLVSAGRHPFHQLVGKAKPLPGERLPSRRGRGLFPNLFLNLHQPLPHCPTVYCPTVYCPTVSLSYCLTAPLSYCLTTLRHLPLDDIVPCARTIVRVDHDGIDNQVDVVVRGIVTQLGSQVSSTAARGSLVVKVR